MTQPKNLTNQDNTQLIRSTLYYPGYYNFKRKIILTRVVNKHLRYHNLTNNKGKSLTSEPGNPDLCSHLQKFDVDSDSFIIRMDNHTFTFR